MSRSPSVITAERDQWERRLVSLEKAAAYLDTTPRTVRNYVSDGRLTAYRVGKRMLRVDLNDVDAMLRRIPTTGRAS